MLLKLVNDPTDEVPPGVALSHKGRWAKLSGGASVNALNPGLPTDMAMARITLSVHSALDGVGLTAAVAAALAEAGIPCNMVAAFHHDHAFVPLADAPRALAILKELAEAEGAA